jgi:hypothetical protein
VTKVFLSYARADGTEPAQLLQSELESAGFEVWRDVRDLNSFVDFGVGIERAIVAADVVVVCLTPSIAVSPDSFVRREIRYAQSKGKRITPVRVHGAPVPIDVNHLTWIDVRDVQHLDGSLALELRRRLDTWPAPAHAASTSPRVHFVQGLLGDIFEYLASTTEVLLDLAAIGSSSVQYRGRGGLPSTLRPLRHARRDRVTTPGALGQSATETHESVLLRGGPGSGKTTSLLVAAREAATTWLGNTELRLPLWCRAADWHAAASEPLVEWLHRSAPLLNKEELIGALQAGRVALFIDGLDELPLQVIGVTSDKPIDPRAALLSMLPAGSSAVVSCRSDAMKDLEVPAGFDLLEIEPIGDEQVQAYTVGAPKLAVLFRDEPDLRGLATSPLSLGLLSYIAGAGTVEISPELGGELNGHLRIVRDFVISRWDHERERGIELAPIVELVRVLGRVGMRRDVSFTGVDAQDAAGKDGLDGTLVLHNAVQLTFLRPASPGEFVFFHPLFSDYFSTVHCRHFLGVQAPDGWDRRLFDRIGRLRDKSFIPSLVALAGTPFWRGEFGDDIANALSSIGEPDDPGVVAALLHLAAYPGLMMEGIFAVGRFARRSPPALRAQFVERFSQRTVDVETIHQLVGLGDEGLEALARILDGMSDNDPWRGQIESYSLVRDWLLRRTRSA